MVRHVTIFVKLTASVNKFNSLTGIIIFENIWKNMDTMDRIPCCSVSMHLKHFELGQAIGAYFRRHIFISDFTIGKAVVHEYLLYYYGQYK